MVKLLFIMLCSGVLLFGDILPKLESALAADIQREKFLLKKVDTLDSSGMRFIKKYLTSDFGLYAYKSNYILPLSYASSKYLYWDKDGVNGKYEKQYETEFQISLRKPVLFNLLGFDETLTFAYTQKVWWQIYSSSSPFRENNYQPEVYVTFPTSKNLDREYGLKGVRFGFFMSQMEKMNCSLVFGIDSILPLFGSIKIFLPTLECGIVYQKRKRQIRMMPMVMITLI